MTSVVIALLGLALLAAAVYGALRFMKANDRARERLIEAKKRKEAENEEYLYDDIGLVERRFGIPSYLWGRPEVVSSHMGDDGRQELVIRLEEADIADTDKLFAGKSILKPGETLEEKGIFEDPPEEGKGRQEYLLAAGDDTLYKTEAGDRVYVILRRKIK